MALPAQDQARLIANNLADGARAQHLPTPSALKQRPNRLTSRLAASALRAAGLFFGQTADVRC
jgi:hypothetical protein